MNSVKQKLLLWSLAIIAIISLVPTNVFAVSGSVWFFPNGGPVPSGSEFTVEVQGNVPDPGIWGGGATIKFTYDASKLQLVSYNDTNGVFSSSSQKNWTGTGNGTVRYEARIAWNAPGVNNQKIISAKFKAIGTGTATLSFTSETNVNNGPTSGTPSSFTLQAPTCPSGQIGTPPNCTTPTPKPTTSPTPKPTTSPTPPSTPKPTITPAPLPVAQPEAVQTIEDTPDPVTDSDGGLKIENVKVTTTRSQNAVSWILNKSDATPKILYGTAKNSLKSEATVTHNDDGSYEAVFTELKLGTLYYFTIKAMSPNLLQAGSYSGSFTTRGYPVQLTIKQSGVLTPGAKVKINDRNFTANKNAIVSTELSDGVHDAVITPSGSPTSYTTRFTVAKKTIPSNGNPPLQSFILNAALVDSSENNNNDDGGVFMIGGIALGSIGMIGLGGFMLYRRKRQQDTLSPDVDNDLLLANYGQTPETIRSHTPEPNLDVHSNTPLPQPQTESGIYSAQQQDYAPAGSTDSEPPVSPEVFTPTESSTALPLPPVDPQYVPEGMMTQPEPQLLQDDDNEQLSQPVTSIENREENGTVEDSTANTDRETAVYHPETGELDILHGPAAYQPTSQSPHGITQQ